MMNYRESGSIHIFNLGNNCKGWSILLLCWIDYVGVFILSSVLSGPVVKIFINAMKNNNKTSVKT